jgi:addiction module RelE/StbE family toxin
VRYRLVYPESYIRRARKFLNKHPDILKQYQKTLELLELNPIHPSLRLHKLQGRMRGLSSVSINIRYRIVIQFYIEEDEIILVNIGTHNDLY